MCEIHGPAPLLSGIKLGPFTLGGFGICLFSIRAFNHYMCSDIKRMFARCRVRSQDVRKGNGVGLGLTLSWRIRIIKPAHSRIALSVLGDVVFTAQCHMQMGCSQFAFPEIDGVGDGQVCVVI